VLRREAEATVLPNLPALPGGNHQPQDKDERLALPAARLATCEFQGLHGAAARLYSDAFDAEPKLTEAVPKGTRYYAARTAARAGCGQGRDENVPSVAGKPSIGFARILRGRARRSTKATRRPRPTSEGG